MSSTGNKLSTPTPISEDVISELKVFAQPFTQEKGVSGPSTLWSCPSFLLLCVVYILSHSPGLLPISEDPCVAWACRWIWPLLFGLWVPWYEIFIFLNLSSTSGISRHQWSPFRHRKYKFYKAVLGRRDPRIGSGAGSRVWSQAF